MLMRQAAPVVGHSTALLITLGLLIGCGQGDTSQNSQNTEAIMSETTQKLTVSSDAFKEGEAIPKKYTADGQDVSPPLSWEDLPDGTESVAVICDDPDAPTSEPFVHWVIYSIPATTGGLDENIAKQPEPDQPQGAKQGENSFGKVGYGGPAPPRGHGTHRYHFKVFALDNTPDLGAGASKRELLQVMNGHVLAAGEIIGTYER